MARHGWLVGLAGLCGALLWTIAAWPVAHERAPADAAAGAPAPEPEPPPSPREAVPAAPPTAAVRATAEPKPAPAVPARPTAPEQPTPAETLADRQAEADQIFIRENGPLDEYKRAFETEPRDSAAHEAEHAIREAFVASDGPGPVFRSVLCRETICKIDVRVSADNLGAYVAAMARIVRQPFDTKLATERTSLAQNGEVSVAVYAKRSPR